MFKSLRWKMEKPHCHVYCGQARVALIVWRAYCTVGDGQNFKGHYSVFLYFGEGAVEHAIPSDNIKHAKLFVKDKWREFKKEIVK